MKTAIAILTTILLAACSTTTENEKIAITNKPVQDQVIQTEEEKNYNSEESYEYEEGTYDELF